MKNIYKKRLINYSKQSLVNQNKEKIEKKDIISDNSNKLTNPENEPASKIYFNGISNLNGNNYSNKFDILVIEDNPEILEMLTTTLESITPYKFEVTPVKSAEEAQEKINKSKFDLIISDNVLPGMSGIELLTKVKDEYPETMRILITGYSDMDVVKDAINKAAVNAYIEKPLGCKELTEKVIDILKEKNLLRRRQDLTPLEHIYESDGGPELFSSLFSFTPKDSEIHTVVEKSEEDLEIKYGQEKINLLSKYGVLKKVKNLPLLIKCPNCQSYDYKLVLKCPSCNSENLSKGEVIEHYSCSTINFSNKFIHEDKLICPKCNQDLRRLGVDYRKIGNWIFCENCSEFYGEANINLKCNTCKTLYSINESIWEEEEKIVPDRAKILKIIRRLSILSELEKEFRRKGLEVRRNLVISYMGMEKKFDIAVYKNLKEDHPYLLLDVYIDQHCVFLNEIKSFYTKAKDLPYGKPFFVAVPHLDKKAKKMFDELKINVIEIEDSNSVNTALNYIDFNS